MKKRLLSILLMCCMVLTLLPTTAFAEESTETPPGCTCETACAVETMNAECSVCGAEGASAENCAKYIKPADDAAVQPEGEVSDPQPETALMALSGEGETPAASGAVTDVSTAADLTAGGCRRRSIVRYSPPAAAGDSTYSARPCAARR